jgi:hypothetical protein
MENYPGFETKPKRKRKPNGISIDIVIQSHLSDAAIEIQSNPEQATNRIQFVKRLIHEISINKRISEDRLDRLWIETVNY